MNGLGFVRSSTSSDRTELCKLLAGHDTNHLITQSLINDAEPDVDRPDMVPHAGQLPPQPERAEHAGDAPGGAARRHDPAQEAAHVLARGEGDDAGDSAHSRGPDQESQRGRAAGEY